MNFYEQKINQIRIALGMEVKMAEAMLEDGVTRVEAEAFEPGKKIFVVSEAGEKVQHQKVYTPPKTELKLLLTPKEQSPQ